MIDAFLIAFGYMFGAVFGTGLGFLAVVIAFIAMSEIGEKFL